MQYPRHEAYGDCPAYQIDIIASLRRSFGGAAFDDVSPQQLRQEGAATATLELSSYGRSIG